MFEVSAWCVVISLVMAPGALRRQATPTPLAAAGSGLGHRRRGDLGGDRPLRHRSGAQAGPVVAR